MAGRKRKHNPNIPIHIDQSKLPNCVYWDKSGTGRWYISYFDSDLGKQKTKTIADSKATLSELHKIVEEFNGVSNDTLNFLIEEFKKSIQYKQTAKETQTKYAYGARLAAEFPAKNGKPLGVAPLARFTAPTVQKLIDSIAVQNGPTAARHCKSFLTRAFRWGNVRGYCGIDAVTGLQLPKERKKRVLPELDAYERIISFAKDRAQITSRRKGALPPYLWCVIEICYLCRLRGIEAITLTDANETDLGVNTNRRKGSRDNIVSWTPRLREAWDGAKLARQQRRDRNKLPTPARKEDRWLFISDDNFHLRKSSLDGAMQRLMDEAIEAGVITKEQRFSLHPVKRRGVTDTAGNRADKQTASGHKDEKMLDIYDMELPVVMPAEPKK